jgi:tetratricopeptide (TPR) repeat protein
MSFKNILYLFLISFSLLPALAQAYTSDDYFKGALSYYQQKNYTQAIKYLKMVVQTDTNNWQAYQILGNCYHQIKDDSDAVAAYDKSLAANPNNPGLKRYTEVLRATSPTPTPAPESKARAMVREYYDGVALQEHARNQLRQYGQENLLTREDRNIVNYNMSTCARDDRRFQLGFAFLGPTIVGLDAGLSLEPTMNLGITGVYIPGSLFGESGEYYYSIEPRIKFYSSPKDASFFWGFGTVFGAGSSNTDGNNGASWIAPNFKFGLSLVDSNGLYFELDWSVGVLLASNTTTVTTFNYSNGTYSNSSSSTSAFGAGLIPGLRIGLSL